MIILSSVCVGVPVVDKVGTFVGILVGFWVGSCEIESQFVQPIHWWKPHFVAQDCVFVLHQFWQSHTISTVFEGHHPSENIWKCIEKFLQQKYFRSSATWIRSTKFFAKWQKLKIWEDLAFRIEQLMA